MECLFTDNGTLITSTQSGTERAAFNYQQTYADFGLMVSIPKSKHMVTGRLIEEDDQELIGLEG